MTERITTQKNPDGTTTVWKFNEVTELKLVLNPRTGRMKTVEKYIPCDVTRRMVG